MPTNTYVILDSTTITSATPTVTFSGISGSYQDLVMQVDATASANSYSKLYFNGVQTSTYSGTVIYGTGSGAGSGRQTTASGFSYIQGTYLYSSTSRASARYDIQNYASSSMYKTVLGQDFDGQNEVRQVSGVWASNSPITSVTLERVTGNWSVGSKFTLYGIVKGAAVATTAKATGGTIKYASDGYTYHVFTSSGTFTPTQSLTCDYLVVAGGGGGSRINGGGGGGGLRSTVDMTGGGATLESAVTLSATGYTVTVGAGGAGSGTNVAANGSNSVFGSITSLGGGGGGAYVASGSTSGNGNDGGSGGGGGFRESAGNSLGGSGTTGQGYAGGGGTTLYVSGGGGGAGGVGFAGITLDPGGRGGIGAFIPTFASATNTGVGGYYAGGGGAGNESYYYNGGVGGLGGGGNGADRTGGSSRIAGSAGTTNTGGGGGGGENGATDGYAGGSGIVIIRYAN